MGTPLQEFRPSTPQAVETTTLEALFEQYEPISVSNDGYIIVQQRMFKEPPPDPGYELGSTGSTMYGHFLRDEYNPALRGQAGLRRFDEMRRSDAAIRASLRLLKTPVLAGRWFVQPASNSARDKKIADFIWKCLTEYMSISWMDLLTQALLMLDFGYFMFEKVFDNRVVDGEQRVVWKKLAPRHPLDVTQWWWDENGGPRGVTMYDYSFTQTNSVFIPIDKLLVFTNDKEAGVITGISALRSAYKHWYFKDNLYKIDAIQKERHGIGIPIIKLPPNFSETDRRLADEIGRNLRVNEKAHVVLPPMWDIAFAKLEGQPVDAIVSIQHHNLMIMSNILGQFLDKRAGNVETDADLFLKSSRYIADVVRDTINKYAIPQLIDFNFTYTANGYPQLKVRRVGETTDWRTMSFAIRNFVGANILHPDDKLEDWVRDEMDLPTKDEKTDRVEEAKREAQKMQQQQTPGQMPTGPATTKSSGAQPGLPRQSPSPPIGPGGKRVGGPTNNSA